MLTYNLPGHDDFNNNIALADCMKYLEIVIDYIKTELHTDQIYSYATSFGGYLVLKYIKEHSNPFAKIALRCPAVNMYEVLTETIMSDRELSRIQSGENVPVGFDRKVIINRQFVEELWESDIRKLDYTDLAECILSMHGTSDEVVPFEAGKLFAYNNFIKFIPVEDADHRFTNPAYMEIATKTVIEFFGF